MADNDTYRDLHELDECPECQCPRITFRVGGCPGVCECECHD